MDEKYTLYKSSFYNEISQGAKELWVGVAIATYCIFMFLISPILGTMADIYGRKKVLMLSLGISFRSAIIALGNF